MKSVTIKSVTNSCCWRGPPGSGKATALRQSLRVLCQQIEQQFVIQKKVWDAPLGEQTEDGEEVAAEKSSQAGLPMEVSPVHWGFDVARMSLQDKQYIKAILLKWGRGNQVLSVNKPVQRCLVFYHAHLLSSESILFLQSFLECNHRDSMVWLTSELPVPPRLADWFEEIPVAGPDRTLQRLAAQPTPNGSVVHSFEEDIRTLLKQWQTSIPVLEDVQRIRSLIYSCLHRNVRWCEGFHIILFALHDIGLDKATLEKAVKICISQPYTGPGQTVPSYRIPMLWEHFFLLLRECLAPSSKVAALPPPKKRNKKVAVK